METNVNNFSEEKKSHSGLKTETKRDYFKSEIEGNAIIIIAVQSKALKLHTSTLKEKLNYALKGVNDAKLSQNEEKDQVLYLKDHTEKKLN